MASPSSLNRQQLSMLQAFLKSQGHDPGPIDGLWGPRTNAAWMAYAQKTGTDPGDVPDGLWNQGDPAATPATGAGDRAVDANERAEILKRYPSFAPYLDHPELGPLLSRAYSEGWGGPELQAAVQATGWWRSHTASAREFDTRYQQDPATVESEVAQEQNAIAQLAGLYGISITPHEMRSLAINALRLGWDDTQLKQALVHHVKASPAGVGSSTGQMKVITDDLKARAKSYFISYDDQTLHNLALQMFEGRLTADGFEATLKSQAKSMYPHLTDAIDSGRTPAEFFAPIKQRVAMMLDLPADQIDLTQTRFAGLTAVVDEKGQVRSPTFTEVDRWARQQTEFAKSRQGYQEGFSMLNGILDTMGVKK